MALYDPVDGVYRKVKKLYDPVDGVHRNVKKAYDPVDGIYRKCFSSGILASDLAVGDSVWLSVNGTLTEFIVVQQGAPSSNYNSNCNGTWLLMKDVYSAQKWNNSEPSDFITVSYQSSNVQNYLDNTFYKLLDSNTKDKVLKATIPYLKEVNTLTGGGGIYSVSASVFLLSGKEVGGGTNDRDPTVRLSYFATSGRRVAYRNGDASDWWLRSVTTANSSMAQYVTTSGSLSSVSVTQSKGVRPALILDSNTLIDENTHTII